MDYLLNITMRFPNFTRPFAWNMPKFYRTFCLKCDFAQTTFHLKCDFAQTFQDLSPEMWLCPNFTRPFTWNVTLPKLLRPGTRHLGFPSFVETLCTVLSHHLQGPSHTVSIQFQGVYKYIIYLSFLCITFPTILCMGPGFADQAQLPTVTWNTMRLKVYTCVEPKKSNWS